MLEITRVKQREITRYSKKYNEHHKANGFFPFFIFFFLIVYCKLALTIKIHMSQNGLNDLIIKSVQPLQSETTAGHLPNRQSLIVIQQPLCK